MNLVWEIPYPAFCIGSTPDLTHRNEAESERVNNSLVLLLWWWWLFFILFYFIFYYQLFPPSIIINHHLPRIHYFLPRLLPPPPHHHHHHLPTPLKVACYFAAWLSAENFRAGTKPRTSAV